VIAAGAANELREFVELADLPAVLTLMGLGGIPSEHPNFISMPGMHGSYASNMALTECDLLIALGVRFDDRVTGRLAAFAPARQGGPRGYRPRGNRQEPRPRRAHRGRREARAHQAE